MELHTRICPTCLTSSLSRFAFVGNFFALQTFPLVSGKSLRKDKTKARKITSQPSPSCQFLTPVVTSYQKLWNCDSVDPCLLQLSGNSDYKSLGHTSLKKFSLEYKCISTFPHEETATWAIKETTHWDLVSRSSVNTLRVCESWYKYLQLSNQITLYLCDQDNLH